MSSTNLSEHCSLDLVLSSANLSEHCSLDFVVGSTYLSEHCSLDLDVNSAAVVPVMFCPGSSFLYFLCSIVACVAQTTEDRNRCIHINWRG